MRPEGELSDFDECSWHAAVGVAFVDIQLQILVWDVIFKPRYDRHKQLFSVLTEVYAVVRQ